MRKKELIKDEMQAVRGGGFSADADVEGSRGDKGLKNSIAQCHGNEEGVFVTKCGKSGKKSSKGTR